MERLAVSVLLPIRAESPNRTSGEHWSARRKRAELHRSTALWQMRASGIKPALPAIVTMTRIGPREMDRDNAIASLKAAIDGVADFFGVPDNDRRIEWRYGQRRGAPKQYAVEVTIAHGAQA